MIWKTRVYEPEILFQQLLFKQCFVMVHDDGWMRSVPERGSVGSPAINKIFLDLGCFTFTRRYRVSVLTSSKINRELNRSAEGMR